MVGRQTPLLGLIVPFVADRDSRWPARDQAGVARRGGRRTRLRPRPVHMLEPHLVELTDIVASTAEHRCDRGAAACLDPAEPLVADHASPRRRRQGLTVRRPARVCAPFLVIVAVFSIAQLPAVKSALAGSPWTASFEWPGLDVRDS